jgi:tetratricopeptide (TPR) repeat protein
MASRIEQLEGFVNEDPKDPFNLYALGLEHAKSDTHKAVEIFNQLLKDHPDYVPTYYQFGKLLAESSENEKALNVFDVGITVATNQKDLKALRELQSARQELLLDLDDQF